MDYSILYSYPVWVTGLLFLLILLLAMEVGFRVGYGRRKKWPDAETGGGGVVLTAMLALLGLILAFTYSASTSRFDARRQAVITEANALGTAFLQAGLVDEPGRSELRESLLAYAKTRVVDQGSSVFTADDRRAMMHATLLAQSRLWPLTEEIVAHNEPSPIVASLVNSVNGVLDMHTVRVMALIDKLPSVVLWLLVFIASASLAVTGFNAGVSGRMSRWRLTMFALVLAGVMLIIIDLDRPRDGWVTVNTAGIDSVISEMEAVQAR